MAQYKCPNCQNSDLSFDKLDTCNIRFFCWTCQKYIYVLREEIGYVVAVVAQLKKIYPWKGEKNGKKRLVG